MARVFVYDNRRFPDPDESLSVDQVKASLSAFFGELATAEVETRQEGEDQIVEFRRRIGTKG